MSMTNYVFVCVTLCVCNFFSKEGEIELIIYRKKVLNNSSKGDMYDLYINVLFTCNLYFNIY